MANIKTKEEVAERINNTVLPDLPSYIDEKYKNNYIGSYRNYEIFLIRAFDPRDYVINNYRFGQEIVCATREEIEKNDFDLYSCKKIHDMFSDGFFDESDLEKVYYGYCKLYLGYRSLEEQVEIDYTNQLNDSYEYWPHYRQINIVETVQYLNYKIIDFSSDNKRLSRTDSSGIKTDYILSYKCVFLGKYFDYDFFFPLIKWDYIGPFCSNYLFGNKFYFSDNYNGGYLFAAKDGDAYYETDIKELYSNKIIGDNHVELMARRVFSYYLDQANDKEIFTKDFIDSWNKNYKNPGDIYKIIAG